VYQKDVQSNFKALEANITENLNTIVGALAEFKKGI
jgi:hypothetical protein